jgi:penicillin-binding protein 1A
MSVRSRQRHRRSKGSAGKKVLGVLLGVVSLIALAVGGLAVWVLDVANSAPPIATLKPKREGANTKVYNAAGQSIGYVQSQILSTPVKLDEIPLQLQQATIAIEDEHFYEHNGVDTSAIIRAAVKNFEAGKVEQGASTITQQLVRNLYIKDPEDTLERKIQEAKMAMDYEKTHTKDQILTKYLNTAPYGTTSGRSAIGVEAASEVYFNKNVKDLDLAQEALLAGLPQAPSEYNPFLYKDAATARRNQVLDAMAGQGYITQAKADEVKQEVLGRERGYRYEQRDEQYFFDFVQDELIDKYGTKTVQNGGLRVYTTLDPTLQAAAQTAIAAHPTYNAANALVSTDTHTGAILAMASSSTYEDSQFNLAVQGERQPGSSFKTFLLTDAVDQGIDPDSTYYPAPATAYLDIGATVPWSVAGDVVASALNLRDATAFSVNTVFAELGLDLTPTSFDEMAHKLGVTSELDALPAEAIGGTSNCCTVLEMSNAYATIANGGVHHDPTAITKVVFPGGRVDKPEDAEGQRVISDGVAYEVADVLKGPLDTPGGTAYGQGIGCPAAGKTGTTEEQVDAWFVGFTPNVSTAVWTGNPISRTPLPGYGADLSAPIWHDYMAATTDKYGCDDFPTPENPVTLSPYTSGLTGSAVIPKDDTSVQDGTDTGGALSPDAGKDANGDGYPDDAYAPGVQGDAPDSPTPDSPTPSPPPTHDTGGQSPGGAVPIP